MANADYHSHPYVRQLNDWHLELSMLRDLLDHILTSVDGPEWLTSGAHISSDRLAHLVESFPFPPDSLFSSRGEDHAS